MELEFSLMVFMFLQALGIGSITAGYLLELKTARQSTSEGFAGLNLPLRITIFGGLVCLAAGLFSALLHLGHPERFLNGLSNFQTSWLAREGIFGILAVIATGLYAWRWLFAPKPIGSDRLRLWFGGFAVALGQMMLFSTSMLYAVVRPIPLWNTPVTVLIFFASSLSLGILALATSLYFGDAARNQPAIHHAVLSWSIAALLVLIISNGFALIQLGIGLTDTSTQTLGFLIGTDLSLLLGRALLGLVIPLGLLVYVWQRQETTKLKPELFVWVSFGLLIIGEIMAKILFFQAAYHV